MGYQAANWLERPEREEEEKLTKLVKALKLKKGDIVADIGAGSGVLSFQMAKQVGADGKVLAVDVQQEMLDRLQRRMKVKKLTNVETILSTDKSPKLPPESIDLAIMVDVYHEFAFPYEMVLDISKALKPGGRVVFVEYRLEDPEVPIKLVHKMTEAQVKKEISQDEFGLKWKETIETLPRQHIIIFEKPKMPAE
jgi:ubiquinone/menaquinone biosynthesis C-methylase UbiE